MTENKTKANELSLLLTSLRHSFALLGKNDPMRMAGATAFFTTFALPPIVFILSQLFGLFIGRGNMGRGLIKNISNTLGEEGADQVRQVVRSISGFSDSWYVIVFGFLFLVFVATTLFSEIKNSLNQLWQISVKENPGLLFVLRARARSFAVILLTGILFFADLFMESVKAIAGNYIDEIWHWGSWYFKSVLSQIAGVIIVAAWFIFLFRFLADGKPTWKASVVGGLVTGILFIAGKLLLRFLLVGSNIGSLYGTAGSFVLVLLFVFYSSFILYYGASFIAVYSEKKQWPIIPGNNAYKYKIQKMKNQEV
ncbi:MAG TPA: YihY/virulence factor BrkB family protein [Chitinophagaceae bacterium]|nr:YihY/virulence factor BrkB family protein [Chitinophagaceae bacterium]